MATHDVVHEVFYDGDWQDVHTEVHEPAGTRIQRGFTQFGDIRPASIEWTFLDPDAKWVPDNPMSPLYGKVGRATPFRVTVDGQVRCTAEAAIFEPDEQPGRKAKTEIRADGILARIASWTEQIRSPMFRAISRRSTLLGHWSMEEGSQATQLSNSVGGGQPGTVIGVQFGDSGAPDGAESAVSFTNADNTSRIGGNFLPGSTTAGWQIAWSAQLDALPTSVTYLQVLSWRCSNGYRWTVDTNQDSYRFRVTDSAGTLLEETLVLHSPGFGAPTEWITFRMKATASGGTVTAEFAWYRQGQEVNYGTTGTFSGTLGRLVSWTMNGNAWMQGALVSHVYGVTGDTDDLLDYAATRAFDGYVNELAGERYFRLLEEEGIFPSLVGDEADTLPMGRQRPGTLHELLQEIADTDRCLIYDARFSGVPELRTRVDLYRQTAVEFVYPDDIAPPFRPRYDYVGVANRVTASQRDGGEATAVLETGPMSVQPAPDGINERKASIEVNVGSEVILPDIAGWELAQGTLPGARFPQVTINLDARPDLETKVESIDLGDRISIPGFRYDDLDLMVIGIDETARRKSRKVTFTLIPGAVFSQVGEYDDTVQRYDSASTTLKAAAAATFGDTFEAGAGTWSGSDATVAASALAHTGSGSLLVTAVGTPAQSYVRDYARAIQATGGTYRTSMWVRSPQALSVVAAIDGVDNGFGYIDGGYSSTVVLVPDTWTRIAASFTLVPGVTQLICGPTILTPANGDTLYLDDIVCGDGAAVPDLLTFRTADPLDVWDTGAEPYDVFIDGERLRVRQVGAASLVSGEYDQAAICTRAVNGVYKPLPAGAEIHIATPGRYAL
jgi:hypothetical protein